MSLHTHSRTPMWKHVHNSKELLLFHLVEAGSFISFCCAAPLHSQRCTFIRVLELQVCHCVFFFFPHKFLGPNSGLRGLSSPTISLLCNLVLVGSCLFRLFETVLLITQLTSQLWQFLFLSLLRFGITCTTMPG